MHYTAKEYGRAFFKTYTSSTSNLTIVDIGSQDVNGALREDAPVGSSYIGLDFVEGKSVDIVLKDSYHYPLPDNYADAIVTSSCFEHSQFFWITFLEALRILKPTGVLYINAPSNGAYHRYPTDNWRFYPDASKALSEYANTFGLNTAVLESFIGARSKENVDDSLQWRDFVAIFVKDALYANLYPDRIYNTIEKHLEPSNIWTYGNEKIISYQENMNKGNFFIQNYQSDDAVAMILLKNKLNQKLFDTTKNKEIEKISVLIELGADVNYFNEKLGATALYWAAQEKDLAVAEFLLKEGADPEIVARNKMKALTMSVANNDYNMTKLLIEKGANIEAPNGLTATPIHVAAHSGYNEIIELLLENGANKDLLVHGKTAFERAIGQEHYESARLLANDTESFCAALPEDVMKLSYAELCVNINEL